MNDLAKVVQEMKVVANRAGLGQGGTDYYAQITTWADRITALRGEAVAWQGRIREPLGEWLALDREGFDRVSRGNTFETRALYTAPPAPVVDDAMVDRAFNAYMESKGELRDGMKAALEAAFRTD